MSNPFKHLFSPLSIRGVTLRNRIMSTGHHTLIAKGDTVDDGLIAYHEARAAGGAGLIITEVNGIHETARYTNHLLMATNDDCIAGFERLAQRLHAHDTAVFVQLFHPGREIMESEDGTIPVAYAPSVSPSERFHVIPREMPVTLIKEIITGYADAARRAHQAGIDGVEIVASHGYLPAQFLNEKINRRQDSYGGSSEKRLHFVRKVLQAVRAATSEDFVIGMRISGDEKDPQGLTDDMAASAIAQLEPLLDFVNVVAGTSASLGGAVHIVPPMALENAYVAPYAWKIKQRLNIPVFVAGRINQPQQADSIIKTGAADMCGMTRAMICDPEMGNKAAVGAVDDIRACIGCNQACIGHFHRGYPISCIQHPETGRELRYGQISPVLGRKKIMVVGGGPAGMKAATIAAKRGHHVTLHEQAKLLGGQALLAQMLPDRMEFGGIITNLSHEMTQAGVKIMLDSTVTRQVIQAHRPDMVIIATGGVPRDASHIELGENIQTVNAWQILRGEVNPGASVLIADWRCDWTGPGLAQKLAQQGCHVRLAVNGLHVGQNLPFYVRDIIAGELHKLNVEVIPYARLYGADDNTVYLQHTATEEAMMIERVDTLVLALGQQPQDTLLQELDTYDGEVIAIGDCLSPRSAEEAVFEGLKAGWRA